MHSMLCGDPGTFRDSAGSVFPSDDYSGRPKRGGSKREIAWRCADSLSLRACPGSGCRKIRPNPRI